MSTTKTKARVEAQVHVQMADMVWHRIEGRVVHQHFYVGVPADVFRAFEKAGLL